MSSNYCLQETTKWNDNTPNHIYILDNANSFKAKGYIPQGEQKPVIFTVPIMLDRRGRTFKKVTI